MTMDATLAIQPSRVRWLVGLIVANKVGERRSELAEKIRTLSRLSLCSEMSGLLQRDIAFAIELAGAMRLAGQSPTASPQ
jgi:hypothetical protein